MIRRITVALLSALLLLGVCFIAGRAALGGDIQPIRTDSVCPVAGCSAPECHAAAAAPVPDGSFLMVCPDTGCAASDCHAWTSLTGHYMNPSTLSMGLWILLPACIVAIGIVIVGRGRRRS